jgi:hypothetical protein
MAMLTLPLFLLALFVRRRHRVAMVAAAAAGIALWAVPLVVSSGGPAGYLRALGSQADEDFSGVAMLWTNPSVRMAAFAVFDTFVRPWESAVLAGAILALAAAGALVMAIRAPRALSIVVLTFGPYAIFHLLFQETVTTRYALPLVPLMAYLVAATLAEAQHRVALAGAAVLAVASLSFGVPAALAFGREPSPIFGFLSEARMLQARGAHPMVGMHRRIFTESKRARAYDGELPGKILTTPRDYEWLELTRAWREGEGQEAWFIADPRRTDLALIDQAHARTRRYRWPFDSRVYVGGARPNELDWHILSEPGWFLEQGWALTPEVAGITDREGWGPHRRPSVGWVRRRVAESLMVIGGRHLGSDPPVKMTASIDGRPVMTLDVKPGYFLEFVSLPAGTFTSAAGYAPLTVTAQSTGAGQTPPVAIEQFNLQTVDKVQFAYDEGWFEPEYNPSTAKSWRWMSERAVVRIHHAGQAVTLRLTGESPLRYFDEGPLVRVMAGSRVLTEVRPSTDFTATVTIPADALAAASGRVTITSDRAFAPGEREGTADRRRLALRIYSLAVDADSR